MDSDTLTRVERLAADLSCEAFGHHASDDAFAEYPDGLIVSRCIRCQRRMTMDRVPGGVPYLRAKRLTTQVLEGEMEPYTLLQLAELEDQIAQERARLDEAEALIKVARKVGPARA